MSAEEEGTVEVAHQASAHMHQDYIASADS
jgi:hypothetical protein